MAADKLIIFDTTLRDGEQSPGASMTGEEKLQIATALEQCGVDVIEAGFAAASSDDFKSIAKIAATVKNSSVCSLARALKKDVEKAGLALAAAVQPRIHTFIATSKIHMQYKLKMSEAEIINAAIKAIIHAKQYTDNIEFSCEDAVRSEQDFLCRIIEAAIKAGATTINIPDTVGYAVPHEFGGLIKSLLTRVPNASNVCFSAHCHNDLGLAVANSIEAVRQGVRQVECTINGLGERAGNAALEEIVMITKTRHDIVPVTTQIDATHLVSLSKQVSQITGFVVQPNKSIVGINAFAHEAGIHQDGILKHRSTYEIMTAADVGWTSNRMVLGKHAGKHAVKARLQELNIVLSEIKLAEIFIQFKKLADKKHEIFDEDLYGLIKEHDDVTQSAVYELIDLQVTSKTAAVPQAQVVLNIKGVNFSSTATGSGPVDAIFKAIEKSVTSGCEMQLYSVNAITSGTESQGQVTVRLARDDKIVNGLGIDTDIIVSSAKAYINALNLLEFKQKIAALVCEQI